jgi:hypothetical protein
MYIAFNLLVYGRVEWERIKYSAEQKKSSVKSEVMRRGRKKLCSEMIPMARGCCISFLLFPFLLSRSLFLCLDLLSFLYLFYFFLSLKLLYYFYSTSCAGREKFFAVFFLSSSSEFVYVLQRSNFLMHLRWELVNCILVGSLKFH